MENLYPVLVRTVLSFYLGQPRCLNSTDRASAIICMSSVSLGRVLVEVVATLQLPLGGHPYFTNVE